MYEESRVYELSNIPSLWCNIIFNILEWEKYDMNFMKGNSIIYCAEDIIEGRVKGLLTFLNIWYEKDTYY